MEVPQWKVYVEHHEWQCEPANDAARENAESADYPDGPMVRVPDLVHWLAHPDTRELVEMLMRTRPGETPDLYAHEICATLTNSLTINPDSFQREEGED